jgi:anti-sigma B factor antagonist
MAQQSSRLMIQKNPDYTIIEFLDKNLLDEANIQQVGDEITEMVEQQTYPRLLLNFENVDHMASAALGTLLTINKKVRQKDGQLKLSNISPQIYEVFVITKLNKLFQIYKTNDDAIKAFK